MLKDLCYVVNGCLDCFINISCPTCYGLLSDDKIEEIYKRVEVVLNERNKRA